MTAKQLFPWIAGAALIALPFVYREPYHLHILILILIWSFAYTSWSMMGRFGLVSPVKFDQPSGRGQQLELFGSLIAAWHFGESLQAGFHSIELR